MPDNLEIIKIAKRTAYRYEPSKHAATSDTYTFTTNSLLIFIEQIANRNKDTKRMDWLADRDNKIGNVMLPQECIEAGLLDGLRGMIDEAMNIDQTTMAEHNE